MKIVITGSTGLIGRALINTLEKRGDTVVPLTRPQGWNPSAGTIDRELFVREAPDAVVHLAGENLAAKRWSAAQKQKLLDSRVGSTELLSRTLASLDRKPRVLVSASAIGIYGDRGDEPLTDESPPGEGFLPELCKAWEAAANPAREAGIRVVHPRLGVVLAKDGGALKKLITPFKLCVGGRLGSGKQWMSWVAREDVVGALIYALDRDALSGALNVVAPHSVRNKEFTAALASALKRPAIFPMPSFILRLLIGEMADAALLASACVVPARLQAVSFPFRFRDLPDLLVKTLRS